MAKTVKFVEFRQELSEFVNLTKYKGERFLVIRNGKPVGAFVPVEDLEKIEARDNSDIECYQQNPNEDSEL